MGLRTSGPMVATTRLGSSYAGLAPRLRRLQHTSSEGYASTVSNLNIGSHTRVIFQGFTGKQATQNAQQSIEYGTKIVGGVTPGKDGEHLGLPVFPTVRAAKEHLKPDATAVYVAAPQAAAAIEEAIEAEIPLIVAVAEHIPLHHLLRVHAILRTQSKSRLVGANSPGMISATGRCRIGFHPLPTFLTGAVGIVAKSGTLSYESVASTTRAGIGQSLVIGMGGDPLPGTDFVDALKIFEHDEATQGIIIIGELGGTAEEEAAEWIKGYGRKNTAPKPILALIGGIEAPRNRTMGHAGAYLNFGGTNAKAKIRALEEAGATIVTHPAQFGDVMKPLLQQRMAKANSRSAHGMGLHSLNSHQRRDLHTFNRRPKISAQLDVYSGQRKKLHVGKDRCFDMLKACDMPVIEDREGVHQDQQLCLALTLDRTRRMPCVRIAPFVGGNPMWDDGSTFPFTYGEAVTQSDLQDWALSAARSDAEKSLIRRSNLAAILGNLIRLFYQENASFILIRVAKSSGDEFVVISATCELDDGALRINKTPEELQVLREKQKLWPEEVEAAKDGIVYWRLPGQGSIGTLVNGAGLAMNTHDTIRSLGGLCTNFLDTGGKATKETIKSSFRIILTDRRVKVIFVNIFGGLTLCDMIAEGIMLAYKDLGIEVPVVVRLRGSNEGLGQMTIAESGLPLYAFDDFTEAAKKAIKIAGQSPEGHAFGTDLWQEAQLSDKDMNRLMKPSPSLSAVLDDSTEMSRSTATRRIFGYATKHGLLKCKRDWKINCDDKLKAVFKKEVVTGGELHRMVRKNMSEIDGIRRAIRPVYE